VRRLKRRMPHAAVEGLDRSLAGHIQMAIDSKSGCGSNCSIECDKNAAPVQKARSLVTRAAPHQFTVERLHGRGAAGWCHCTSGADGVRARPDRSGHPASGATVR